MQSRLANLWWLFRRAFVASYEDGCFAIAKGAAYSALLSFVPVLTAVATILVQLNAERVSSLITRFLFNAVPPGAEELVQYSFTLRGEQPDSLLVAATLVSLWAAGGLMATLMDGFNAAYRLPSGRPFLRQRMVAILLVLIAATPVASASVLLVLGDRAERWVLSGLGVIPAGNQLRGGILIAGAFVRYALALGAIALATAFLFYVGPNRRQQFKMVWPGALLATGLWLVATVFFAWYVRNIANYNVMYGSVGAVVALIVWMYVLSVIALIGCEFNAERERMLIAIQ
jgi:membrane protein